jgi:hypothetical protein
MANEKLMKGHILDFAAQMKKLVNCKDHRWAFQTKRAEQCTIVSFKTCSTLNLEIFY